MLSFKFITSSGGAAHYFESSDDYYAEDGMKGQWAGEGAEKLGLKGGVDTIVFKNLLDGRLPSGEQVRKRMPVKQGDGKKSKERLGIDFTFSAPKSVSIAALINDDKNILKAHDEAVKAAIKQLEARTVARKKVRGISFRQHTNNLAVATFRHDLSRTKDPQLHTHAVAMNLTQRDDERWVAITNDEILKATKVVGAFYRANLAQQLESMGYEIRATKNGFELSMVPDAAIKLFSKRSAQIEKELEKKGLDRESAKGETKQKITKATRPTKTDSDRVALREEWLEALKDAGITLGEKPNNKPSTNSNNEEQEPKEYVKKTDEEFSVPGQKPNVVDKEKKRPRDKKEDPKKSENSELKNDGAKDFDAEYMPRTMPLVDGEIEEKSGKNKNEDIAERSVNFAIEHLMERQGIFTKSELQERAYMRALGAIDEIDVEIGRAISDGRLVAELPLYQSAKSFSKDREAESTVFQYDKFKHDESQKLTETSWVAMTMLGGKYTQEQAEKIVQESISNGRLVRTEERFTTGEMLLSERAILNIERAGRGVVQPIMNDEAVRKVLEGSKLNDGQREAAKLILTTENRIVGVQGFAGVGKSHMLNNVTEAIKNEAMKIAHQEGYQVIGLAPYASQNKALKELGIESQTLASFLNRASDQAKLNSKALVFLDESSVVPAHQMKDLLKLIETSGARIVLLGDRKQTQAVEAGKPFEQLQDSGMTVAHITEILRQKNHIIKAAVMSAAKDDIKGATRILVENIEQIKSAEDRHKTIARDYVLLPESERNKTLIVAGTNVARLKINEEVRNELKLSNETIVKTYNSVDMTRAEKKQAGSYEVGQVILPETKGNTLLNKGTYYEVLEVKNKSNELVVRNSDGEIIKFDVGAAKSLSAFSKEELPLAVGDWVRTTRNNSNLGIENGGRYKVVSINNDVVELSNGVTLSRTERLHMQYGYATTVHSSQGLTTDRVFIDADSKSVTSNRALFYVAISRPRNELKIYTDDKAKIGEVMEREPKKYAALELRNDELEKKFVKAALASRALAASMKSSKDTTEKAKNPTNTNSKTPIKTPKVSNSKKSSPKRK